MNTLLNREHSEFPPAYLLARLRGRRGLFIRDWEILLHSTDPFEPIRQTPYGDLIREHSEEGIWKLFLRELRWVYQQMNKELKDIFQPFFLYCELKTIVLCLRLKMEDRPGEDLASLLKQSVLSKNIKDILRKSQELEAAIDELNSEFFGLRQISPKLQDVFHEKGLKGVEETVINTYIERIAAQDLHPAVKNFFVYIIDIRNILTLYKYVRWAVQSEPSFISGGSFTIPVLQKALSSGSVSIIGRLAYQRSGRVVHDQDASDIEHSLMTDLTRRTRIAGRISDPGFILDYLWTAYIAARNLSIIVYGKDIERDVLRRELVIR